MADNTFINGVRAKAAEICKRVAFPDAADVRSIEASRFLADQKLAEPVLVGYEDEIKKVATDNNINLDGIEINRSQTKQSERRIRQYAFREKKK